MMIIMVVMVVVVVVMVMVIVIVILDGCLNTPWRLNSKRHKSESKGKRKRARGTIDIGARCCYTIKM